MARDIIDTQIRDTNTHASTDLYGDVDSTFQFVNGLDVTADYVVEGTYDADDGWADPVEVATGSINSDSTASTTVTAPWDRLRVTVTAASAPTSGSFVAVQHVAST